MATSRGVTVYRWGDWGRARTVFKGLAFRLNKAAEEGLWEEAQAAARRIKKNIYSQNYPHHPLSEWQASSKSSAGKDPRILIEDGNYVKAITAMHLGRRAYGVGIPAGDEENLAKGLMHEWGGVNNFGHVVPARPHYRIELERMQNGRLTSLAAYLQDALRGKDFISGSGNSIFGINDKSELDY